MTPLPNHHLSLRDGDLYTCPACEWRAVQTTRGLVVTAYGDAQASHHAGCAPSATERRAWVERIVTRLREQYTAKRAVFWELYRSASDEGQHVSATSFGSERDDGTLTLRQLQRLIASVESEYEE